MYMAFSENSNPKLGYNYIVYVILVTCLVFLFFQLANDKGGGAGNFERFHGGLKMSVYSNKNETLHSTKSGAFFVTSLKSDEVGQISPVIPVKKNLMFVKTHKCGTSTLVDVFYLRGVRHRLNFVMHPFTHQLNVASNR